ncbi:fused MFS/spermidine synthase [Cognatishimia sp. MH4019]|uniref:fused MFS/spermidine synthase n=1 Tax=Cognatishimia sp. MH4019 TaxID=2854030 RepID=UPI001CD6B630|nr:fused MFS/spermidine synthase [Cognatishimia sp. MH4019]
MFAQADKNQSDKPAAQWRWLIPVLFTSTIFLSASLLFFVQPLFAKLVLPHIGGAPAVWTTAMLFFQTVLIAGYLYAHLSTKYLPVKAQIGLHLALWALALFFLPLSVPDTWSYDPNASPALQTLILFALGVGLPFAVLSANAPLIQSWYAKSGGPSADDPYFLYGASNLGSLIALLAFPLVAEPLVGASTIGWGWAMGFVVLGAGLLISGLTARGEVPVRSSKTFTVPSSKSIAWWLALAFVPSSLMLALTTKLSQDLGSVPLIWVLPLSLYLVTFVVAFRDKMIVGPSTLKVAFLASLALIAAAFSGLAAPAMTWTLSGLLLLAFFVVATYAHRKLYETRPDSSGLTLFYVIMSVGGALGGLFNSILAPALFDQIQEGRVTVLIAAALLFVGGARLSPRHGYIGLGAALIVLLPLIGSKTYVQMTPETLGMLTVILLIASLVLLRRTPLAITVALVSVTIVGSLHTQGDAIHRDRSFFGTHRIFNGDEMRLYANGTTVHGAQFVEDIGAERPRPLFYYHQNGPMAQVLTAPRAGEGHSVGIVGLGIGALACYAQPSQDWHFYEIDPTVDQIARTPELFSFVTTCTPNAPTHLGDARIVLEQQDHRFDTLVIDAYSSDSVPVHLTTLEALEVYLDRLDYNGVLVFHISNRYYDVSLPLGRAAEALGLKAYIQDYNPGEEPEAGDTRSLVVMMARNEGAFGTLTSDPRWEPLQSDGKRIWTDDFADLLSIMIWN